MFEVPEQGQNFNLCANPDEINRITGTKIAILTVDPDSFCH